MQTRDVFSIRQIKVTPFVKNITWSQLNNRIKEFELTPGKKIYLYTIFDQPQTDVVVFAIISFCMYIIIVTDKNT